MLTGLVNTLEECLKQIALPDPIVLNIPAMGTAPAEVVNVPIFDARKSTRKHTEIQSEQYPQKIIYHYFPEFDMDWNTNWQKVVDGYHNFTGPNGAPTKAWEYEEPLRFLFKLDMTFYMRNAIERIYIAEYMLKRYGQRGQFILNAVDVPVALNTTEKVGDVVGYTIIHNENTRTDGIYEINYELSVKAMVQILDPKELDLITNFNLILNNVNP